jgi:phage replication O-like protein O
MENFTQIPNIIIDEWMKTMHASSFMVLMVICRKTLGWQKEYDFISLSQIQELTGISRPVVIKALKELADKDLIIISQKLRINQYKLNLSKESLPIQNEIVKDINYISKESLPIDSKETLHTKEINKEIKQKKYIYPTTLKEIELYAKEKLYIHVDCAFFFKYFTDGNWHDMNNNIVKNWKLKLLTWEEKAKNNKPKDQPNEYRVGVITKRPPIFKREETI